MLISSRIAVASFCIAAVLSACGGGGGGTSSLPPNPLFVRVFGSDTNVGGDATHALRTISKAASLARDGYTIVVGPGRYNESVTTATSGAAPQALMFIADATGAQTGDPPGSVIVDATGTSQRAGFKLSGLAGGLIDGFTITGSADAGIVLKKGDPAEGSHDFTIQNCIVHDNPGDGIRVQDSASVLAFNNLVFNNGGAGIGIVGNTVGSPNARLYHNTIYGNQDHGITIGTSTATAHSSGAVVINNIVQNNDATSPNENIKIVIPSGQNPPNDQGFIGDCNLVYPPKYSPLDARGPHDSPGPAMFANAAGGDFHLQSGSSPALDYPSNCALIGVSDSQLQILRQRTTTGNNTNPGPPDTGLPDLGFHFLR